MRVGVDFHTWDGIFQGSRSHVLEVYKQAIKLAPDIEFCFFLNDVDGLLATHSEFGEPNVRLVRMRSLPSVLRLAFQLSYLCVRNRVDVLHMQYRIPLVSMTPTVCTIHDVLFEDYPQYFTPFFVKQSRLSVKWAARHADKVLTVSQYSRLQISEKYCVPFDAIDVTANAWNTRRFSSERASDDLVGFPFLECDKYIISVGRLEPRKNYLTLIRAWARLGPSAPNLLIVGQPDFDFDDVISESKLADPSGNRIRILSDVGDGDLPKLIRNAMFFVYLAHAEGFGMPPLEAMACGVPVIASNTTSLPEVVGEGGILVDQTDPVAVANSMLRLINDEELRHSLKTKGLAQAAKFNWRDSATTLVNALREVAAK